MPDVRARLFELRSEGADLILDELLGSLQGVQMGALGFGLLPAQVEHAMEAKFKSFHGLISGSCGFM